MTFASARRRFSRRPRRRPASIPRNSVRRARSPQPPVGVEHYFTAVLHRNAAKFASSLRNVLTNAKFEQLNPVRNQTTSGTKTDAIDDDDVDPEEVLDRLEEIQATMASARAAVRGSRDQLALTRATIEAGDRAQKFSEKEFLRVGIKVNREPTLKPLISGWTRDTIGRIDDMEDDQLDKLEKILVDGYGERWETLADRIEEEIHDVTESRAEFIARDSVLTLNGKITSERQTAAGIEQYIWTTTGDERVRDSHAELDGETFSWNDPPEVGHPGEDYNCRCTAFPVVPFLDDDTDNDDTSGDGDAAEE